MRWLRRRVSCGDDDLISHSKFAIRPGVVSHGKRTTSYLTRLFDQSRWLPCSRTSNSFTHYYYLLVSAEISPAVQLVDRHSVLRIVTT